MYLGYFKELFLTVVVLLSTFKNKNSLRTIEAQIVQKLKNNEAWPKFTGSYKKKHIHKVWSLNMIANRSNQPLSVVERAKNRSKAKGSLT